MISAKEAAKKALDYFFEMNEVVGLTKEKFENLAVDEVDTDGENFWEITIGYELPMSVSRQIVEPTFNRQYRKIKVGKNGQVTTMKILTLANE